MWNVLRTHTHWHAFQWWGPKFQSIWHETIAVNGALMGKSIEVATALLERMTSNNYHCSSEIQRKVVVSSMSMRVNYQASKVDAQLSPLRPMVGLQDVHLSLYLHLDLAGVQLIKSHSSPFCIGKLRISEPAGTGSQKSDNDNVGSVCDNSLIVA